MPVRTIVRASVSVVVAILPEAIVVPLAAVAIVVVLIKKFRWATFS
jgi:hypothetical protein